nr:3-dehydroquinate synthase [Chloroflexota bacterium]
KRLRSVERILEWLAAQRVERGTPLVAVGGGTIGDLAGTAAALFARGLPLVQVPTTWLAQADSAIGGKVAVDLSGTKNAVGAFWPPVAVIADVAALRSLPVRLRRDGMAESIKAAMIGDPALWLLLEERGPKALRADEPARYAIMERSARLKLGVCQRDPFESGERRTLNLGHTIGHALEIESRYRLAHGAAVALGLRAVAAIGARRGADPQLAPRLDALLSRLGFVLRRSFDGGVVRAAMLGDKKRHAGRQRWILPMEVGRVIEVDDVTDAEVGRALRVIGE